MVKKGMFIGSRYEVLDKVGSGGMSDVYKAKDHKLNRYVAIKVLKSEFSKDKNFVSKFRVEAQSAARLEHPNIVNVYDVGEDIGMYYIVMELVEGITLKQYIARKKKLSVKEATSIAIQIAQGIECAHNNQIVHRDIKPQNIIISREGKVKVTDFGIAKAASANTINGNAMGSVHYISPEQARGGYVDERSDIYSLGITMYEMLTGSVPFNGDNTVNIALQHIQQNVPDIRLTIPEMPISISKIVLKSTQNKSDRRYPNISSLITDLKRSLLNPYEDFVQVISEDNIGSTVMITDDEASQIKQGIGNRRDDAGVTEPDDIDDDIDSMNPKMEKIITIGGIVAGVIMLAVAIVVITLFVGNNDIEIPTTATSEQTTIDPRQTQVPDVVGMTEDEAEATLHDTALGYRYAEYVYSDEFESGIVCSQSVEEGTIVDRNSTVELTVSKGPEKLQMPEDIEGAKLSDVLAKLDEMGLVWQISYEYSSDYDIDIVMSSTPGEEVTVSRGDTVQLTVSRGEKTSSTAIVPTLIGKKIKDAKSALKSVGLNYEELRYEYSDVVAKNCVIRQTIKAGGTVPKGTTVRVIISKGPEPKETEITTPVAQEYYGTHTFALEELRDSAGNPITSGVVTIMFDGVAQNVDPNYTDISKWNGDYTVTVKRQTPGTGQLELIVNGVTIQTVTIELK